MFQIDLVTAGVYLRRASRAAARLLPYLQNNVRVLYNKVPLRLGGTLGMDTTIMAFTAPRHRSGASAASMPPASPAVSICPSPLAPLRSTYLRYCGVITTRCLNIHMHNSGTSTRRKPVDIIFHIAHNLPRPCLSAAALVSTQRAKGTKK